MVPVPLPGALQMPFLQFALLRPDRETFGDNSLAGCAPALHGRGEQGLKPDEPLALNEFGYDNTPCLNLQISDTRSSHKALPAV